MMKYDKKGFTLVEIISILGLLSLLFLLLLPNVTNVTKDSKLILRQSKISALETAGEKYGNDSINTYQKCVMYLSKDELISSCMIEIDTLLNEGYIENEESIVDPVTNKILDGKILLCYNGIDVDIYAQYVDDENYSCKAIDVESGASMTIYPTEGTGYINGLPVFVNVIKNDNIENITCEVSDNELASCKYNSLKNRVEIKPSEVLIINENEKYKETSILITGSAKNGEELSKIYNLRIYPTELKIIEDEQSSMCVQKNTNVQYKLEKFNTGELAFTFTDKDILTGYVKDDDLILESGNKSGEASVTIKEKNGNKEATITKNVYSLEIGVNNENKIPRIMPLGSEQIVKIYNSGTGPVTVSIGDSSIATFASNTEKDKSSIVLDEGENIFKINAKNYGSTTITIKGTLCGEELYDFSVTNIDLDETSGVIYAGGDSKLVDIDTVDTSQLQCNTSSDMVSCVIKDKTLEITAMDEAEGEVLITLRGPSGLAFYNLSVIATSIDLVDGSGNIVNDINVCSLLGSNENNSNLYVKGSNIGRTLIDTVDNWNLVDVSVAETGIRRRVTLKGKNLPLDSADEFHVAGYNSGRTKITIKEDNGYKKVSLYYNIYSLTSNKSNGTVEVGKDIIFDITARATGEISAVSEDTGVATVSIEGNDAYSDMPNAKNYRKLRIKGISVGKTKINIKGSICGSMEIEINVIGRTLTVNFEPGKYSTSVEKSSLSCVTIGTSKSCDVILPAIYADSAFEVLGYALTKNSKTAEYRVGSKLTLSEENDGTTYYGISEDKNKPICTLSSESDNVYTTKDAYITLTCIDDGSGIINPENVKKDSFVFSDNKLAEISNIENPESIENGYSYKIKLNNKYVGSYSVYFKQDVLSDDFYNTNSKTEPLNLFSTEYEMKEYWFIGKNDEKDVMAILYDNSIINENETEGTYSLRVYGEGEMQEFSSKAAPWLDDYRIYITKAVINDGITNVGSYFLMNATNLEELDLGESIEEIENYSFANAKISSLIIPNSTKTIGTSAFYKNEIIDLDLGYVVKVGDYAFSNHNLKSLELPNTLREIGDYSFESSPYGDLQLTNITLNSLLTKIPEGAFKNHMVENLIIPSSIKSIMSSAFEQYDFYDHSTLKNLIFEDDSQLTEIGDRAFFATGMSELSLPSSVEKIGKDAFTGLEGLTKFKIGPKVRELGDRFLYGKDLREFEVDINNKYFTVLKGVLYSLDMRTLVKCPDAYYRDYDILNVPLYVKTIKNGAFAGWADYDQNTMGITLNLPSNLTTLNIDENFIAFTVSEINISGNSSFTSVDGVLFNKNKTTIYRIPTTFNSDEYTIPNTVNTIYDNFGFSNSRVMTINIPSSVSSIGEKAFQTDTDYAFETINLYSNDSLAYDITSFEIVNYGNSGDLQTKQRTINVKYEDLKTKIENMYIDSLFTINVNLLE